MRKKILPIYSIENFNYLGKETDFYANTLKEQLTHNKDILLLIYLYKFNQTHTRLAYIKIGRFLWFIMIVGLIGFALSTII